MKEDILEIKDEVIALRRHFHQYPEASLKEYKTAAKIKEELDKLNISYETIGETGVLGVIQGGLGEGKTVLLRADIDALELNDDKEVAYKSKNKGLNHACGHDGHTAALLGAARILKKRQSLFKGTVKLAFQQAEEIGAGGRLFVQAGALKDVDGVFGIHLDSSVEVGKLVSVPGATNASCDIVKIVVHGKSSHVAAPHLGIDALATAASIIVEAQKIVSRQTSPLESVVVGFGVLNAGTRYNIVANRAEIEGTVRAFSHESRAQVLESLKKIAENIAESHGASIEFEVYDAAAPLINDEESAKFGAKIAEKIVGKENVITNFPKSLGADDFADFLAEVPGVYGRVGTKNHENPDTHYAHHHNQFDIDEESLLLATQFHTQYALDYLS